VPTSAAFVETPRAQRYTKQLVSHFGTKVSTEMTDTGGTLSFGFGTCTLEATPTGIRLEATAGDDEELDRLEDVVARHLVRFGSNDALAVSWER